MSGAGASATPRGFAFQHPGLDRADHLRSDDAALAVAWPTAQVLVIDLEGQLRHPAGEPDAPRFCNALDLAPELPAAAAFLGVHEGIGHFALPADALAELPPATLDLRSAAALWPPLPASVFAQARALLYWQQRNRFCGACGHAITLVRGGHCARCTQCGLEHYPRTDPAVIVAVTDGERVLLGRQASWPAGRWSVLAGFLEPGESLEQTVVREVWEEAGVRVHDCTYAASQPWPFPASLMVGFHARAEPQEPRVADELEDARWFAADELVELFASGAMKPSPKLSIARFLLEDWLRAHGRSLDASVAAPHLVGSGAGPG